MISMIGYIKSMIEGKRGSEHRTEGYLSRLVIVDENATTDHNVIQVNCKDYIPAKSRLMPIPTQVEVTAKGKVVFRGTFEQFVEKLSR